MMLCKNSRIELMKDEGEENGEDKLKYELIAM
jgi:hypothetical protein